MKPFSLHGVHKYRKQLQDAAAQRLTQAQLKMQGIKDRLDKVSSEYDTLAADLNQQQNAGMELDDLVRYETRLQWLKEKVSALDKEYQASVDNFQAKRKTLILRSRNKKIMDTLKSKQDQQWKAYLDKKENEQLDEIAVLAHERKNSDE